MTTLVDIDFTEDEITELVENIDQFLPEEQNEILKIAEILQKRQVAKRCYDDLIAFCQHMDPNYKVGKHHRRLANFCLLYTSPAHETDSYLVCRLLLNSSDLTPGYNIQE